MGILDDIQQLQMQRIQQAAQQGFAQPDQSGGSVPPPPDAPYQSQSQIGNSFPASAAPQPQPDQQPPSGQPGGLQQAMSDYAGYLLQQAQNLHQYSGGAGNRFKQGIAAAAAHQAGIPSQYEAQLQNFGAQDQALKTAVGVQQTGLQSQMVTLPNGMSVPIALAKTLAPAMFRAQTSDTNNQRNNDTKKLLAGYNDDGSVKPLSSLSIPQQLKAQASDALNRLNKAKTDALNADPNTGAGQLALSKLQISEQMARASITKAAAASGMENIAAQKFAKDYIDGMQDEEGNPIGVQQYKAQFGADKPPAAMLQSAEFARGGLGQLSAAEDALRKLEASGTLRGVPSNKLEDWLFGKGLVDPSLPADQRALIGKARAALGYTSSATMRAHTGRTSFEIYRDIKNTTGMAQGTDALHAALDQTRDLLTGYANQANKSTIHALRTKAVSGGTPDAGVITLTDGGKSYKIPAALKANFLKDHPNAR